MDVYSLSQQLQQSIGTYLPMVLGAVGIFVVGLLLALFTRGMIRKAMTASGIEQRIHRQTESHLPLVKIASLIGYWFVLILTLIGVFSVLRFDALSGPFSNLVGEVMLYLPRILLAAGIALVAWLVAVAARLAINRIMQMTQWDEKLSNSAGVKPIASVLGHVIYWLVLLLFLPAVVTALNIEGIMMPLTAMTQQLLEALPQVFAALLIGGTGWLVAKVVRGLVTQLLASTGVDSLGAKAGMGEPGSKDGGKLSELGGTLAFVLVIVPALIAALDALGINAISAPATQMLGIFMDAIPHVLAAAAILIVAWYVGRFAAGLVTRLLSNLGFDGVPARLGLGHVFEQDANKTLTGNAASADGAASRGLSAFVGHLSLFFVMLFAAVEAAHQLGFTGARELLETFIAFGADLLLGAVILVVGYWLADVTASAIQRANPNKGIGLSRIARVAILGLVLAMGLRAMGIADDIVNLAFGLILGAVAIAIALAFGLGGRDAAGKIAERWARDYLQKKDQP
ncbi:mechanosensitive ion channel [Pseudoxanthomonas dokdonensis]|uniref:Small-conductance mechanosensitive channel n=1 Tax=Pseudoxanthomonas dokdonensis TaxID=344882 RepID=A0A0R0CNU7_9GAMM|nr:mechanosensitive ion channel [Pseudoxanthomonas dokdonensis]KRG71661.1 hypothetical protein ABB29_02600 [Pseudoxanthomonas dokdonensis]